MQLNRHNTQITPITSHPLNSQYNYGYADTPQYGGNASGSEAKLARLREWRRIIYRHKWLILSIVLIILPLATIQAYRAKPIYQATTTIDVRSETSSLSKTGNILLVESNDTKSEMVIIRSTPIIRKTIAKLNLDKNPRFLDVTTKRSILEAITSLKGDPPEREKKLDMEAAKEPALDAGVDAMNAASPETGESDDDAEMLPTTSAERNRLAPYVQTLLDNLNVEGVRDTRLIKISFRHTDPDIAAAVTNGVAKSFISYSYQTKTERFNKTSSWLEETTRKLRAKMEKAEQRLVNYTRENNIISLEGKENLRAEKLARYHDQALRAEFDRIIKQSLYEEVQQGRGAQLPEAYADPKTAEVRKKLNDLAVEASQLSVKFGAKNPRLLEVQKKMATYQDQLKENQTTLEDRLKADYGRAIRDEAAINIQLERAKSEAVQQNQAAIQYSVLQQDLATAKALYTEFLNTTTQADIQRAEQFNNVRMIEEAEAPGGPIGPNRNQTILFALAVSLVLGIGLAYFIENLNTTIRTVEDLNRFTQAPLLAVIPSLTVAPPYGRGNSLYGIRSIDLKAAAMKDAGESFDQFNGFSDKPVLVDSMKMFSGAAEAYRMLRTSILLSTAGRPPKTMLLTSGQPGDGKTTTAFNIALALTQLKAKVVIVDCDMRKPRIHRLLQMTKSEGLSTLLTNGGELEKFISRTPVPHLSVLPCGYVPPNPSELISSESMKEVLRGLSEQYDYVIVDSPPLFSVSDPIILSTLVEGVILVIKSGHSKSELVRRACQDLSSVGARLLGVTLNSLDIRKDGYEYYRHYRHYVDYIDQDQAPNRK
jgi:polysaccharide biosynthesis transport protein